MANQLSILIIEDEKDIRSFLTTMLSSYGYSVIDAVTGKEAISMVTSHMPDLILLDIGLPDMDGMNVLSSIREWSDVPVIIVSARQDEDEKVRALDLGADDYVTKPFGNSELLARIRSSIRRHSKKAGNLSRMESEFFCGGLHIDYVRRNVTVDGKSVHLTPIEYKIVVLLAKNAGKVLTHDNIIRKVWGPFASDTQILRVNMANIRRKFDQNPADPVYITTEVGIGYRMPEIPASTDHTK